MKYEAVIFDLFGTLIDNFSFEEYRRTLLQSFGSVCLRNG